MAIDRQQLLDALASGHRTIVSRTVLADTDTPVSAFLKLRPAGAMALLESVEGGERWGRNSIICLQPRRIVRLMRNGEARLDDEQLELPAGGTPLDALRRLTTPDAPLFPTSPEERPGFVGGWVGFLGYGAVHWIEPTVPDPLADLTPFPDGVFVECDTAVIFDNVRHATEIVAIAHPSDDAERSLADAEARIEAVDALLRTSDLLVPAEPEPANEFAPVQSRASFEAGVDTLREAILAGDAIQIVLSQRFESAYRGDPFWLYRALRLINPSPYLFYLELDEGTLIGSSPEVLVRKQGPRATLRPIAGTRRRGRTPEQDLAMERELLADPKEIAEHVMLVDLGRNDLGRVSVPGSVRLTEKMVIERYSHVMHIVSNVESRVADGWTAVDLLAATFPAGTVSGAPKVKAMQLIAETEPVRRGPYSGAIGYFDYAGDMDTGILIRTFFHHGETLLLQAGAGIVADSRPELEYKETINKAAALFAAVEMVGNRFGTLS
ncbi:MAG: anthranilate synthase component I [Candidatus Dadabacteria bacterium]|nr:MAG: anthranilate synthase component I [Candidatus Dadabacteria bacterium]